MPETIKQEIVVGQDKTTVKEKTCPKKTQGT